MTCVKEATVTKSCRRWHEEGNLCDPSTSGTLRKTTHDQLILAGLAENTMITAVAVRDQFQLDIPQDTVRERQHKGGIHHRTSAKKGKITEEHRMDKLQFAEHYRNEDLQFLGLIIFNNETNGSPSTHGLQHCWRLNGTRYDP